MHSSDVRRFLQSNRSALLFGCVLFALILAEGGLLYVRMASLMQEELRQRLLTTATLAAEQFTGEELDAIHGKKDMGKKMYRDLVGRLGRIRDNIPNIEYAYLMRQTADPMTLEFVADADSLKSDAELDSNGNGVVDSDEEASYAGDTYDIADIPDLQHSAFVAPTVDKEITVDAWGKLISGYAPIKRANGSVAGIVGVDMDAADFFMLSRQTFSPLILLFIILFGVCVAVFAARTVWFRRIEALKMLDDERSSLLALVSHQLGAPIVTAKWWAELLQEGSCSIDDACSRIIAGADRMNGIVRALRSAEKAEHGKESYEREAVSTSTIVREAVREIAELNPEDGKRIETMLSIDCTVRINPKLIHGVVVELIENAIDYSPKSTPIHVSVECNGKFVTVAVSDRGIGIPDADKPRMFQRMSRASNAHLMRPDGNGLGLYVCKTVIERAGGRIRMKSELGKGSTFSFTLPVG